MLSWMTKCLPVLLYLEDVTCKTVTKDTCISDALAFMFWFQGTQTRLPPMGMKHAQGT